MKLLKKVNGRLIYRHNGLNFYVERETIESPAAWRGLAEDIALIEQVFWENEYADWTEVVDDITAYAERRCQSLRILSLCGEDEQ